MPQTITHPTFGPVDFPDSMSDEQIVAAFKQMEGAAPAAPAERPPVGEIRISTPEQKPTPAQMALAAGYPIAIPSPSATATFMPEVPTPQAAAEFLAGTTELAPVIATGAMLGPQAMVTVPGMALMGAVGAFSKLQSEKIRGRDIATPEAAGEAAQSGLLSMYPGPAQGSRFLMGAEGGIAKGLEALGMTALAVEAGQRVKSVIQGKTLPEFKDRWKDIAIPSVFSGGLYATGTSLGRVADLLDEANKRREILKQIGVKNPTLAALLGTERFGRIEADTAASNAGVAAQVASMEQATQEYVSKAFRRGVFSSNEEIAETVNKQIASATAVQRRYDDAQKAYVAAEESLAAAKAAVDITPEQRAAIVEKATEDVFRATQAKASALMDVQALGGAGLSLKDIPAAQTAEVFGNLWNLRKEVGRQLYEPVNKVGAIFNADDLANVAENALGNYANTENGAKLISAIRAYRSKRAAPDSIPNPAALFDPTAPLTIKPATGLDLEDVRQLREHLSDIIDGMGEVGIKRLEREASNAYNAITGRIGEKIGALPNGEALVAQWNKARDYWASTFRSLETDKNAARMLMRGRATADDISAMAADMLDGKLETINAVNDFVKAVSRNSEDESKLVLSTLGSAIRNEILFKFQSGASGMIDWAKAAPAVSKVAKLRGFQEIFPVEALGLGTEAQISQWARVVSSFEKSGLTRDRITEALQNPKFQEALGVAGVSVEETARRALAEQLFQQKIIEAELSASNGLTAVAQRKYREAQVVAKNAKLEKDVTDSLIDAAKKDPMFAMFSGQADLTRIPEATSGRIGDLILRQDKKVAEAWMTRLNEIDPAFAEKVRSNVLGNYIAEFVQAQKAGKVNLSTLRTSLTQRGGNFEKLVDVIGGDTYKRTNKLIEALPIIDDVIKAKPLTDSSITRIADIFGVFLGVSRAIPAGELPKEQFANRRFFLKVADLFANDAYITIASYLNEPKRAAVLGLSRSFSDAISQLPVQQALALSSNQRLVDENARLEAKLEKQGR